MFTLLTIFPKAKLNYDLSLYHSDDIKLLIAFLITGILGIILLCVGLHEESTVCSIIATILIVIAFWSSSSLIVMVNNTTAMTEQNIKTNMTEIYKEKKQKRYAIKTHNQSMKSNLNNEIGLQHYYNLEHAHDIKKPNIIRDTTGL